jgi:hypothetical protein
MVFSYVYYGLFTYTNLVDVISLFFTVFSFHLPNFGKKSAGFRQKPPGTRHASFQKKPANLSVKLAAFQCSWFSLFLRRLRCVSAEFD